MARRSGRFCESMRMRASKNGYRKSKQADMPKHICDEITKNIKNYIFLVSSVGRAHDC